MKIVITGDIHLNLRKNKEFELNRFKRYSEILRDEGGDWFILNGDIFDLANPNLEEINAFYSFIRNVRFSYNEIKVVSGNHEELSKTKSVFHLLPELYYEFVENKTFEVEQFALTLLSHHKLDDLKNIALNKKHILVSHLRSNLGVIKEEVDVEYISRFFDYAILSDIHYHYKPYDNVEYTSQPYNTIYDIEKDNGYIVLEIKKDKFSLIYKKVNLPNKIKLELNVDEYKAIYDSLNDENLYKIILKDNESKFVDLPKKDNVILVLQNTTTKSDLKELSDNIVNYKKIDMYDLVYEFVKNSNELNEEQLEYGKKLLEDLKLKRI